MIATKTIASAPATSLLARLGLAECRSIYLNLSPAELVEHALARSEGVLTETGALMCDTGTFTGRSPKDKFIVCDDKTRDTVEWGDINQPFESEKFEQLRLKMLAYLAEKDVYVRYARACASPAYRLNIAVVTTQAWQSLFCNHLFLRPAPAELADFEPDWTILCVPGFQADPATDGTRKANFTLVDFSRKMILIGGSGYAGEIKKGIFTVLNFVLPVERRVLSMHCSANIGAEGPNGSPDTALFFGLSGTGKTTLSADPERRLIGDDEHGWAGDEIFNFEGGCYAKVINLSAEREPQIYHAIRFGAVLENTRFFPGTRKVDYDNRSVTENTRTAYPIDYIPDAAAPSVAGAPRNIFFLTADAFGVLPPISRLTAEQAMYHFLSGYTSKLAGTEMGITEPVATFSTCFGAAFLPLPPVRYAELLGELIEKYNVNVWLINTGWTGGPYGTGRRIRLDFTRAMIRAALKGELVAATYITHPVFGLRMPTTCPGVPHQLLDPQQTWINQEEYLAKAAELASAFEDNFRRFESVMKTETIEAA
ncbi:phosphoenolpyruvate carboxykinase (ATP) [Tellurirhabdus rosea]|uniref:phosphoenolpyruvate carboxykinase (ATP) n=1 Tax=Tellurirhabdus rosea TaxID=2674997 RepID=UPI00225611F4|nr:phosphoenolpyruvate carboxykinase (ATP) [Tellurirhabdus rosea]